MTSIKLQKDYKRNSVIFSIMLPIPTFATTELILNLFFNESFRFGVRNSLLISPMPTASTAQILGNNESIEPYTSNIYSRRVLSGNALSASSMSVWKVTQWRERIGLTTKYCIVRGMEKYSPLPIILLDSFVALQSGLGRNLRFRYRLRSLEKKIQFWLRIFSKVDSGSTLCCNF